MAVPSSIRTVVIGAQQVELLHDLVKRTGITDSWVSNSLVSLTVRWNRLLYETVARHIAAMLEESNPRLLAFDLSEYSPSTAEGLSMGSILGPRPVNFVIPVSSIPMHWCIVGSSGFGKSEFAMKAADELLSMGTCPVRIFDPKADEFSPLAKTHANVKCLKASNLKINLFSPPPNVPHETWYPEVTDHLSETYSFWEGALSLILRHCFQLHERHQQVTLLTLIDSIRGERGGFGQKDAMAKATAISRLEFILYATGTALTTDSGLLEALHGQSLVLSTSGLMSSIESYVTEYLLLWEYEYRKHNPGKRCFSLTIYDECQHRLFSSRKEFGVHSRSAPLISKMFDEARALNLGICSLSQEPSTLIKPVVNNSWLKVGFRLGSGQEIKTMKDAMGLTEEQAECIHYLEPGEAIVRMAGGHLDPIPVRFDQFDPAPVMSTQEFEAYQKLEVDRLLKETLPRQDRITSIPRDAKIPPPVSLLTPHRTPPPTRGDIKTLENRESETKAATEPGDPARRVLGVWLNLEDLFLTQGELFEKLDIRSGSRQAKIKKDLLTRGYILDHKLQSAKTYVSVWEPTNSAYELIGLQKPTFESKGGHLHQFIAHRIKKWAIKQGYDAAIESMLSNGKAVDLVLRRGAELAFIEVAVSKPLQKEITNLVKDLETSLVPDRLVVAVVNSKAKIEVEGLVASEKQLERYRDKIGVELAGSYL